MNVSRFFSSSYSLLSVSLFGCSNAPTLFTASGAGGSAAYGASGDSNAGGVGGTSRDGLGGSSGARSVPMAGADSAFGAAAGGGGAGASIVEGEAGAATRSEDSCAPGCCEIEDDANGAGATLLADSVVGFSGTQGHCGWSFGYLTMGLGPFTLLPVYRVQTTAWAASESPPPWLTITSSAQHPNANPLAWIDRRWTSGVSGSIEIRGHVAKVDSAGGDGIRASISVDGTEVWQAAIAFDDTLGKDFLLQVDVEVGTALDFIVDPAMTDGHDTTTFTALVSR
ncbi:MAG: hypothetical protein ABUL62_18520 [Myxococcales bacterium]